MSVATRDVLPRELSTGPFSVTTGALTKRYGSERALDGLDLRVPEGAVYVLVGPNGAGKTTLLRTLLGMARRDTGTVEVLGMDPAVRGHEIRAQIGYVPEDQKVGYSWMTVERLLEHHERLYPSWDSVYAAHISDALEINGRRRCGRLSKGERRRVQILLALAHRPALLLLDEPTDGLDHVIRDTTLSLLSEHLADSPTTALISTHRVYEIERLVDHVGVLRKGRLLGQMRVDELKGKLRRYWADVPEGWKATDELTGAAMRRAGGAKDIEWTMWGDEEQVVSGLGRAGAKVREVAPLTLDEAATVLLSKKEAS
ncbi:MAG: ABC transporter ATP-binding protein [Gemmatimonadales bacterium]